MYAGLNPAILVKDQNWEKIITYSVMSKFGLNINLNIYIYGKYRRFHTKNGITKYFLCHMVNII